MDATHHFFATCPKGLEPLLAAELAGFGTASVRETLAGARFEGTLESAYRTCLWSRIASRVILTLATFPVTDAASLYDGVRRIPWREHLPSNGTLRVDFGGTSETISNSLFGAQKVKDAVVDRIRDETGVRPSVDLDRPAVRVNVRLHQGEVTVGIDLSGDSLHRRGYRGEGGEAPLKENLAAAVLVRAGWMDIAGRRGSLVDPLCGSGTFLVEAALMASDTAPGIFRHHFGFDKWRPNPVLLWRNLLAEARERRERGMARGLPDLRGYDADPRMVSAARENLRRAGFDRVSVSVRELSRLTRPVHAGAAPGLLVANPPYGERLGSADALAHLYRHFGDKLKEHFTGWKAALLTGNPDLGKTMGLRAKKVYALFNGPIPCKLLLFDVEPEWFVEGPPAGPAAVPRPEDTTPGGADARPLSPAPAVPDSNGRCTTSPAILEPALEPPVEPISERTAEGAAERTAEAISERTAEPAPPVPSPPTPDAPKAESRQEDVPDAPPPPHSGSPREAGGETASPAGPGSPAPPAAQGAEMFANRLVKNLKKIGKWAHRHGVACYRLYDADMKEYAFAVDRYGDYLHVQEYTPPATVDPEAAQRRLDEALWEMVRVLGIPPERIYVKERRRQKRFDQYTRQASEGRLLEVTEGGSRFLVNLSDYVDTGLFLDLRPLRLKIREMARGKRFLNLFCYTAAATVHAAAGGARNTTSVDLSATYLAWARKNLALNGFSEALHRLIRSECGEFLSRCTQSFDLVLMDVPTFSNSKRMAGTLDIQRDQAGLIRKAARLLAPGGTLFFSTHNRRFQLETGALADLAPRDISKETLPEDFAGDPRIHQCWEIRGPEPTVKRR